MAGWYNKVKPNNVTEIPRATVRWRTTEWDMSTYDPVTKRPTKGIDKYHEEVGARLTFSNSGKTMHVHTQGGEVIPITLSKAKNLSVQIPGYNAGSAEQAKAIQQAKLDKQAEDERLAAEKAARPKQPELGLEMPEQPVVPHQYWGRGIRV